jgi:hypothetical protein
MPTTNTNFSTLITAIDTKAQSLAASTTDPKDLVFLGKTVEALNVADTVSAVIEEGDDQVTRVQNEGTTQVAAVAAQGANYAPLAGATFTGAVTGTDLTLSGNLTVSGTTTTINTATLDVADINITIADGAANSAAADGAGITIEGAGVNFQYSDSGKHMSLNTGLAIEEVKEKVATDSSTTGTLNVGLLGGAVYFLNTAQTANRTINFRGSSHTSLDSTMSVGQSITVAVLATQGTTAYYLNAYQIDGTSVTPKWQGGSAPTGGNASGIDAYTFTIIKTAAATFTVLASQTQFA